MAVKQYINFQLKIIMFLIWDLIVFYLRGLYLIFLQYFGESKRAESIRKIYTGIDEKLYGRVAIIVGGSSGMGREVVKMMVNKGCHVIIGGLEFNSDAKKLQMEIM